MAFVRFDEFGVDSTGSTINRKTQRTNRSFAFRPMRSLSYRSPQRLLR